MAGESQGISSLKFVVDKVSFVNKLPTLNKATYDDARPTPGYLYQEICNISNESNSFCMDLLEYLVSRLDKKSYHVKLKVLRIMRFVVENGHHEFRQMLRRKAHGIQEATKFGGPPDPLHGNAPYLMVRKEAKELCALLFDVQETEDIQQTQMESAYVLNRTMGGMGGNAGKSQMQGFGNAPTKETSLTSSIVGGLKDFAGKIIDQSSANTNNSSMVNESDKMFCSYKPVEFTSSMPQEHQPMSLGTGPPKRMDLPSGISQIYGAVARQQMKPKPRRARRAGVAGGGWEDSDEEQPPGPIPNTSSSNSGLLSVGDSAKTSRPSSATSGISRDGSSVSRIEDSSAEKALVSETIEAGNELLQRKSIDNFIKCCSALNCSKIAENIGNFMRHPSPNFQVHCLQLLEALLRTDLVAADELASSCQTGLDICYKNHNQHISVKAKKVILILDKLCSEGCTIIDIIRKASKKVDDVNTKLPRTQPSTDSESDMFVSSFSFINNSPKSDSRSQASNASGISTNYDELAKDETSEAPLLGSS